MGKIPSPNACMYTEDMLTKESVASIRSSGFTTIIVGLFHVTSDGTLHYNNDPIDSSMMQLIMSLKGGDSSVQTVLFSIGGGNWKGHPASVSDTDYPQMKATWTTPAAGQSLTSKENILNFIAKAQLDGLDLDYEPVTTPFDEAFIAQVTNEISSLGHMVTAAPYENYSNWQNVLENTVNKSGGNNFGWWGLQIYSGVPTYSGWVDSLKKVQGSIGMTNSEIEAFVLPGYFGECGSPRGPEITAIKKNYPNVNGAFLWRYSTVSTCLTEQASSILEATSNDK